MQIFPKLFETFPDAESLLAVEPEELAEPLLISLAGNQNIRPENLISYGMMAASFEGGGREMCQKYPLDQGDRILRALMEAWQWLEREGFVAPNPTSLSRERSAGMVTTYFVTRRGQTIQKSEDLETYRKADLLPRRQLHPIIAQKVWATFLRGDYDVAVFQGFKEVEIAVREAGEYAETDYGTALMGKAFNIKTGKLTNLHQQEAERRAVLALFSRGNRLL